MPPYAARRKEMIEIKGKNGTARVYTEEVEQTAVGQIVNMMNQDWIKGQEVAVMADVHAGAGGVIGLTINLKEPVIPPDLVGSDIGCGVSLFLTDYKIDDKVELAKWLDSEVLEKIPSGERSFGSSNITPEYSKWLKNSLFAPYNELKAEAGMGTLGGGNHFIEAYDYNGKLAISVHSGSRSLGGQVYKFYKQKAEKRLDVEFAREISFVIKKLKEQGRHTEIQSHIETLTKIHKMARPDQEISILTDDDALDYINDVEILTEFATENRRRIFEAITKDLDFKEVKMIDKPHNFVQSVYLNDDMTEVAYILRKGAQSGFAGETVLIPINMRDGLIMGVVRDDPEIEERNFSFPHGAGRVKSRSQAKAELDLEVFKEQMKDVYSTSVGQATLDEAPDAYKSITQIAEHTVHLMQQGSMKVLQPFYNYKSSGGQE